MDKKFVFEMKCDKCNTYSDKNSKYCSNCGTKLKNHKISNFIINFIYFIMIILSIMATEIIIVTKNKIAISIWVLFLLLLSKNIITNKMIYYFSDHENPNIRLLNKLFDFKILSQNDLFTIDFIRLEKGWKSIFNDGEGLIVECENNPTKNEIQQNFINHMKNRD